MSVTNPFLTSNRTDFAQNHSILTTIRHIAGYALCVGLGLLSGVLSTALVMMAAIIIQLVMFPTTAFAPGLTFFAGSAIAVGLGVSWLIGKTCRHLFSNLFQAGGYEMLIITIVGTITSLAQTITFMFIL